MRFVRQFQARAGRQGAVDGWRLEGVIAEDLTTGERMLRHRRCVREHEVIKGDIPERLSLSRARLEDRICTACGQQLRWFGDRGA